MPPAAFSPLATTKSSASSSRRPGSSALSVRRPAEATMSPTKRIAVTRGKLAAAGRILGACEPQSPTPRRTPPRRRSRPRSARRRRRARSRVAPPTPEPPAARRARRRPALDPARHAAARAARRCSRSPARPGAVLLLFIIAGLIALLLNPPVTLLRRGRLPARRGGGDRLPRARAGADRARHPARRPDRQPGLVVPRQRAGDRRRRQRLARRPPGLAGPQRHRPPGLRARPHRGRVARRPASRRARASSPRSPATRCCGWWRPRSR